MLLRDEAVYALGFGSEWFTSQRGFATGRLTVLVVIPDWNLVPETTSSWLSGFAFLSVQASSRLVSRV
jgi:hypothetical protein